MTSKSHSAASETQNIAVTDFGNPAIVGKRMVFRDITHDGVKAFLSYQMGNVSMVLRAPKHQADQITGTAVGFRK